LPSELVTNDVTRPNNALNFDRGDPTSDSEKVISITGCIWELPSGKYIIANGILEQEDEQSRISVLFSNALRVCRVGFCVELFSPFTTWTHIVSATAFQRVVCGLFGRILKFQFLQNQSSLDISDF
jgi:hypothetical protein